MSNDTTGTPDPQYRTSDAAGSPQYPAPTGPQQQQDAPTEQNTWFFGAHDTVADAQPAQPAQPPYPAPQADTDVPELDDNDPLVRHGGPAYGTPAAHDAEPHPQGHPAITPTPIPHLAGGMPATPMPQTGGGQYAPRPMPHQQPSGFQPNPAYQGSWNNNGWQPGALPFNGHTSTVTATPPAVDGTRKRRSGVLVTAALVLALGAGIGGGYLGADLRQTSSGTALTASNISHALTQTSTATAAAATGTVESVAAAVLPSVVSVVATSSSAAGEGSGVILTADGYILTNNHVVEGATDLTVRFNDGTTAAATVVGADTTGDLAVIKVDGVSGLTPAALGSSNDVKVGQEVVAIGSPLGLSATVTSGIVSALNRPVRTTSADTQSQQQQENPFGQQQQQTATATAGTVLNAVQTDAAINPGNSGGALVNMQGQIIGINSAIASLSSGSSESGSIGVGFAIPIDTASRIAQEIIDTGKASHAVLGASVADSTGSGTISTGAEIQEVTADGAAAAAGLQVGDVVTKIDDNLIESADALVATIRSAAPNSQVQITVLRGSSTETLDVTLGSATS